MIMTKKQLITMVTCTVLSLIVIGLNFQLNHSTKTIRHDAQVLRENTEARFNQQMAQIDTMQKEFEAARKLAEERMVKADEILMLTGMSIHMFHPTKKECGKNPWLTSSGKKAKPYRTAAISRKLKKELGIKFGDLVIIEGHVWIIESNMAKKETAHFDLMYPVGHAQFRLMDATVQIVRVASAKQPA
jgi:hypothetical protein